MIYSSEKSDDAMMILICAGLSLPRTGWVYRALVGEEKCWRHRVNCWLAVLTSSSGIDCWRESTNKELLKNEEVIMDQNKFNLDSSHTLPETLRTNNSY